MRRVFLLFALLSLGLLAACSKPTRSPSSELSGGETETLYFTAAATDPQTEELHFTAAEAEGVSVRPRARPEGLLGAGSLQDVYPPRVASFSESNSEARSFTNANWLALSTVEKASYVHDVSSRLIAAHGLEHLYTPRIITCKVFRESTFRPQIDSRYSSAKGISQVVDGTVDAVFRQTNFRFQTPGFEDVTRGSTFRSRMARSMNAQLELGIAVLEVKRAESGSSNIRTILGRYYGSRTSACNEGYANRIFNCAVCMRDTGISERCLGMATGARSGC
ncbi:MAG: hypothetical protein ACRBBP_08420 [Bdellovibrionales bacterium]